MIKFSIIINTHNQDKYIYDAINSCLKQTYKNYEIIIIDSSNYKIDLKKYSNIKKKFSYFHIKPTNQQPELNQINKIIIGFKKSKGDYLVFLDGDDIFNKNKLTQLDKISKKRKIICNQDLPILFNENYKKKMFKKEYKNKFFTKYLLNNWPQIYGTSSILVRKDILKLFLKKAKPLKWKYIAIDAQLILFCNRYLIHSHYLEGLTFKRLHEKNLGSSYMNIFKRKFWDRRYMQFNYSKYLGVNIKINLDYIITKTIYFIFKNL